jgi:hypothetical protein
MPEAGAYMVVDHADSLHEGVADGRADEVEAELFEVLAHGVGFRGAGGELGHGSLAVLTGLPVHVAPEEGVEGTVLVDDVEGAAGVADGGFNFEPVAHDARIAQEPLNVAGGKAGDFFHVPTGEGGAVVFALAQDGQPTEPGLRAFQNEELEQHAVVVHGNAPFFVMVGHIERIRSAPPATRPLLVRSHGQRAAGCRFP